MNYLEKFRDISTLIFDVDGVLTNSNLLVLENGSLLRTMHTRDGFALKRAVQKGYRVCIITGGKSQGVIKRLNGLGITDVFAGVSDKISVFNTYLKDQGISAKEVLYMGDDLPDWEVMQHVALPCCPQDAAHEILEIASYVSPKDGGTGCVRDVVEKVLRLHGNWVDTQL